MQLEHTQAEERLRWIGIGRSSDADATRAGEEAARTAARHDDAALAIVFASDAYPLGTLLETIRGVLGEATPVVGCSTAGEIATDGPGDAGVVVFCLGGPGYAVSTGVATVSSPCRGEGPPAAWSSRSAPPATPS
jgi:hypothetical protein